MDQPNTTSTQAATSSHRYLIRQSAPDEAAGGGGAPSSPPTWSLQRPTSVQANNTYTTVPPGWETAVDPRDGHLYYYEPSTGRRSWVHPSATTQATAPGSTFGLAATPFPEFAYYRNTGPWAQPPAENPLHATRRPDNHQCQAVAALILFPPIGLCALYHSWQVDRCWNAGLYSEAVSHARQAPNYASFGIFVGLAFWIWWMFFGGREGKGWEWPDWNFDWFGD